MAMELEPASIEVTCHFLITMFLSSQSSTLAPAESHSSILITDCRSCFFALVSSHSRTFGESVASAALVSLTVEYLVLAGKKSRWFQPSPIRYSGTSQVTSSPSALAQLPSSHLPGETTVTLNRLPRPILDWSFSAITYSLMEIGEQAG